jgi:hypothetical protein
LLVDVEPLDKILLAFHIPLLIYPGSGLKYRLELWRQW